MFLTIILTFSITSIIFLFIALLIYDDIDYKQQYHIQQHTIKKLRITIKRLQKKNIKQK